MKCWKCQVDFPSEMLHGGLCLLCGGVEVVEEEAVEEPPPPGHDIWLSTETSVEGIARLGIVTGQCILGLNLLKDIGAGVRDLIGGRSKLLERAFEDARDHATLELRSRAFHLGAEGVIALRIEHEVISPGGGTSMAMVTMTGTAVTALPIGQAH